MNRNVSQTRLYKQYRFISETGFGLNNALGMVPRITAAPVWRDAAANPLAALDGLPVDVSGTQRADSRRFAQAMQAEARERPLWMRGDPGC